MIEEIQRAKSVVLKVLNELDASTLHEAYPLQVFGFEMTTECFLIHLQGHLNYHLGQIKLLMKLSPYHHDTLSVSAENIWGGLDPREKGETLANFGKILTK